MVTNSARLMRGLISFAAFSLPLSLLVLSACGGGGSSAPGTSGLMVSTFAGTVNLEADGIGSAARFDVPCGVVSDGANLYVADFGSNTIRKIVIATRMVSTLAGESGVSGATDGFGTAATFNSPCGVTIDNTNTNLYVADTKNNKIRKIVISTGAVSSLTGAANTAVTAGAVDGAASSATFNIPRGITTDGFMLYVGDVGNEKIRQVVIATGVVSSLTGAANTAVAPGAADGPAAAASFYGPNGIVIDSTKTNLYVADTGNNKIRQVVIATGAVSSITGAANAAILAGAADGAAASATFSGPGDITTDGANLYVVDSSNFKIRQITISSGAVSSLTGAANTAGTLGYADGAATAATFAYPYNITAVGGNLYVTDGYAAIRQIAVLSGQVATLAGISIYKHAADGTGAAAKFYAPAGIVSDGTNLYVADMNNCVIRKIVIATGSVTTLAGQANVSGAADGTGAAATFRKPSGITTDGASLYVMDSDNNKIRKITPSSGKLSAMTSANAVVTSLTGIANTPSTLGAADGTAASATFATFSTPAGITNDGANLYVADTNNNKIRKVVISTGTVSSFAGATGMGFADGPASSALFSWPTGITTDGVSLYVADSANQKIRKIDISTGAVSTLAGAGQNGAADGSSTAAKFNWPLGIAMDSTKTNLYVADSGNAKIRKVVVASGQVSSLTGAANTLVASGAADGVASSASFNNPEGIATVGSTLYVTDQFNNTIRKIQ